jgi:hypothetical protein
VKIAARTTRGSWRTIEPCLETHDLPRLAGWLTESANSQWEDADICEFIEPVFRFSRRRSDALVLLSVELAFEAAPPWIEPPERYGHGHVFTFGLSAEELRLLAGTIEAWSVAYPVRA